VLKVLSEGIEEMGGYEEWKKKCLSDEKTWLSNLDQRYDALPFNNPKPLDAEKMTKEELIDVINDLNDEYREFFHIKQVCSSLAFHQKLVTFLQLYLLEEIESETEPISDIIFRALERYVELRDKE